jgi:uncharacterized protein DUF899
MYRCSVIALDSWPSSGASPVAELPRSIIYADADSRGAKKSGREPAWTLAPAVDMRGRVSHPEGDTEMTEHRIGTHDEWLAARRELLQSEKEHSRARDELARRRRGLPWVPVEKEYVFETDEGAKTLADLFDGRSQLLVYHFMFGFGFGVDERNPGCTGCSFAADHFDAAIPHLHGHDVTLVAESIAALEELRPYKERLALSLDLIARQRLPV